MKRHHFEIAIKPVRCDWWVMSNGEFLQVGICDSVEKLLLSSVNN
ncbi:MAG: hypothetical protein WCT99_03435 [Bacteroidota bacterium]